MPQRSPLHDLTAAAGAVFAECAGWLQPINYGDFLGEYRAALTQTALFDLSAGGKLQLTGKDAALFLHNLSTNDVKNLALGSGCEAFLATAKARAVAHVFISRVNEQARESLWLDTEAGMAGDVLRHLDRHLISEQVELNDVTSAWALMHLCGPSARQLLDRCLTEALPDLAELQHVSRSFGADSVCRVRRRDYLALPGYDLLAPAQTAREIWRLLTNAGAAPSGLEAFEVLRVEAGQPVQGAELDENRFVIEVGRTRQAICYTKGCYLGQEPLVMARDRGHVNRTLLGLKLQDPDPVQSGAKVLHNSQEVGLVTSSVFSPRLDAAIALAYLRRGSQEPGTLVEVALGEVRRQGEVLALPFSRNTGRRSASGEPPT